MKIAIIGVEGQLGSDLAEQLGTSALRWTHSEIEITDPANIEQALGEHQPDAVINTAAYNLVDKAETDLETAFRVNAFGPRHLAVACAQRDIPLLHVSTDYVFGMDAERNEPYRETDLPGPVNAYGLSKLTGEQFVRMFAPRSFVVRTCGLYGRSATRSKGNFVQTIRRLATERDELHVVDDQRCTPTSTADLASALSALVRTDRYGLYHATNAGDCTWYEFASAVVEILDLPTHVLPITTEKFPRPARRPAYSVLDCQRLASVVGSPLRPWREALEDFLAPPSS